MSLRNHAQNEEGQAVVLVALGLGLFLVTAMGLAIDGSHLYAQRQMAQAAADAAAQAAMLSVYNGTNTAGTAQFSTSAGFSCSSTTNSSTPCAYASKNGFSTANGDTIAVSYPSSASVPGVTLSTTTTAPVSLLQVTVSRSVATTLMKFAGSAATTVTATAVAGIVSVTAPTPILVTHPTITQALYYNGSNSIKICGGPSRSIQVNSTDPSAVQQNGNPSIDLSHAGPLDTYASPCSTGTGADFGTSGGPSAKPSGISLGVGKYLPKVSYIEDPLANVAAPNDPNPTATTPPATTTISSPTDGCQSSCILYSPGTYPGGLSPGNHTVIFKPGLYYVRGGGVDLTQTTGGGANNSAMCVGCPADTNTGTGMVIYDTVASGVGAYPGNTNRPTGGFKVGTNANISLVGATLTTTNSAGQTVPAAPYYGVVFWEDRTANAHTGNGPTANGGLHQLGQGNGCFTVIGTVYITNTRAIMLANPSQYQQVQYNGNPCSTTVYQGDIIVSTLEIKGNIALNMQLVPYAFLTISKVSLVD